MTRSTTRRKSPQPSKDGKTPDQPSPSREGASTPENASDADSSGEKPVRKQLKETSIEGQPNITGENSDHDIPDAPEDSTKAATAGEGSTSRGRLQRKRSIEEVDGKDADQTKPEKHVRKRSRDNEKDEGEHATSNAKTGEATNGRPLTPSAMDLPSSEDDATNPLASPKNKRNRDEYLKGQAQKGETDAGKASSLKPGSEKRADASTPEGRQAKRQRDRDDSATIAKANTETKAIADEKETQQPKQSPEKKLPASGGFANYAAASPFATLSPEKKPAPKTSSSAFASSGFGKLASSESSPFGALGGNTSKSPSPFGSMIPPSSNTATTTSFATSQGDKSPFGALGGAGSSKLGGFGNSGFSSGFASLSKGPGLSSFAGSSSTGGIVGLSAKPAKPFGTAVDEDEDDEDEGSGEDEKEEAAPPKDTDEGKKDKRFFERTVETGEETETTEFTSRAKLFAFHKDANGGGAWKERGTGNLKLNTAEGDGKSEGRKARLLLRVDGTHNLVLNTPIIKELKFHGVNSDKPKDGRVIFSTFVKGEKGVEPVLMQLRLKPQNAEDLWELVQDLKAQM
ncbi:hypothetical protein P152DRAFT_473220 [Eremomyces bilateralis CBS 781.70]|uniref:RanBD1 domain-containing protein n=1 Tax=Eremomyces bilateralis CBS 781.70 TaxID=1392243 RepID=A0A6G1G6N7_9PEZI|nr:uncharacterized protein P152DRAFT_473220 [Eremomyces bilateralis CBS 781.70]KAF1813499.1 hypothetical protein P152DRAFT_473220 [Eremomyces bilateralis CBS 781.70]